MFSSVFALVTILITFGYLQPGTAEISVEDYLGNWYVQAMIAPVDIPIFSCFRREFTREDNDNSFQNTDSFIYDGSPYSYAGAGKIENSTELIEYVSPDKESAPGVITSYCNGESLIIHYKLKLGDLYLLQSRKPLDDSKTLQELEKIADASGKSVTIVSHDQCTKVTSATEQVNCSES